MFAAVRQALKEIDPEVPLNLRLFEAWIAEQFARPKFLASLLAGFALSSALLALVGVYGVIAYAVKQREHEIAIRMAVGAGASDVTGLFLRQGALVLGTGITGGMLGGAVAGRLLETQLYGVRAMDPLTLALSALAFAATGLAAIWRPARRAARTDPAIVLREE
ncbi:MAG: hypothetical protein HY235_16170 [Acidobacteria bacterium]|nr:hypothetical protein [Acidobacteriota bacterium]